MGARQERLQEVHFLNPEFGIQASPFRKKLMLECMALFFTIA
jgi:hypothetical protein